MSRQQRAGGRGGRARAVDRKLGELHAEASALAIKAVFPLDQHRVPAVTSNEQSDRFSISYQFEVGPLASQTRSSCRRFSYLACLRDVQRTIRTIQRIAIMLWQHGSQEQPQRQQGAGASPPQQRMLADAAPSYQQHWKQQQHGGSTAPGMSKNSPSSSRQFSARWHQPFASSSPSAVSRSRPQTQQQQQPALQQGRPSPPLTAGHPSRQHHQEGASLPPFLSGGPTRAYEPQSSGRSLSRKSSGSGGSGSRGLSRDAERAAPSQQTPQHQGQSPQQQGAAGARDVGGFGGAAAASRGAVSSPPPSAGMLGGSYARTQASRAGAKAAGHAASGGNSPARQARGTSDSPAAAAQHQQAAADLAPPPRQATSPGRPLSRQAAALRPASRGSMASAGAAAAPIGSAGGARPCLTASRQQQGPQSHQSFRAARGGWAGAAQQPAMGGALTKEPEPPPPPPPADAPQGGRLHRSASRIESRGTANSPSADASSKYQQQQQQLHHHQQQQPHPTPRQRSVGAPPPAAAPPAAAPPAAAPQPAAADQAPVEITALGPLLADYFRPPTAAAPGACELLTGLAGVEPPPGYDGGRHRMRGASARGPSVHSSLDAGCPSDSEWAPGSSTAGPTTAGSPGAASGHAAVAGTHHLLPPVLLLSHPRSPGAGSGGGGCCGGGASLLGDGRQQHAAANAGPTVLDGWGFHSGGVGGGDCSSNSDGGGQHEGSAAGAVDALEAPLGLQVWAAAHEIDGRPATRSGGIR
jgi:hypothetical protein